MPLIGHTMKPSPHNYALAYTAEFSAGIGVACSLCLLLRMLYSNGFLIADPVLITLLVISAVFTAAIGWLLGLMFLWPILARIAARIQGWPFAVGDAVWILSGKHKDVRTTVYAVWDERTQVRVNLGPEAEETFKDVFCMVAVCRVRNARQAASPPC